MRVGIDFDNTLACYDTVMIAGAVERNLLPAGFVGTKAAVRDAIRARPDGEADWRRLQGWVYGAGMVGAMLFPGAAGFLARCRDARADVFIVSHKTEFGHDDPLRIPLRGAALDWMAAQGFFDGLGLARERVLFESTRAAKVERISGLGLDTFIDDLPEVFEEPGFPQGVSAILFSNGTPMSPGPYRSVPDWPLITREVFGEGGG